MPGPIMAKSFFSSATFKNCSKVSGNNSASGLSIKAYLVLTSLSPILFPFPYPRLLPDKMHLTFLYSLSIFLLCSELFEFSTLITLHSSSIEFKHLLIFFRF